MTNAQKEQARRKLMSLTSADRQKKAEQLRTFNHHQIGDTITCIAQGGREQRYAVSVDLGQLVVSCECNDHRYRARHCKHVHALLLSFEWAQKEAA